MATPDLIINLMAEALRTISKSGDAECATVAGIALAEYEKVHSKSTAIIYAIGVEHGPNEYGMIAGPTPHLKEMTAHVGGPGHWIIGFKENPEGPDPVTIPLYEWVGNEWVSLAKCQDWASRLHREECPAVNIGGNPTKCTCDRRGKFILGRRGPRQPGEYDS